MNIMKRKIYRQNVKGWYLERLIFLIAGIFVLSSTLLVFSGLTNFIYFTGFIGVLLIIFALTGYCPMAMVLSRFGIKEK